jgi:hypothetical protein
MRRGHGGLDEHCRPPCPDEAPPVFVAGNSLEEQFVSEGLKVRGIEQRELEFQCPIGDAVIALKEYQHLF